MPTGRRRRVLLAGAAAVTAAALAVFLRPATGTRSPDPAVAPRVTKLDAAAAATPPAPPPPPSATAAAAGGPRPPRGVLPTQAVARSAVEEYRRRARYPRASQPLEPGPDPLERDREISPITEHGPGGEDPALTVYPMLAGFESPEPAVLYAYLSVDGTRIAARRIRGTVVTEDLIPIGEVEYRDDGAAGDAVAGDRLYSAVFVPGGEATPALSRSYMVQVVADTRGNEERRAATSFLYSRPHAQLTGSYRDAVTEGSLELGVELEVLEPGRFHVEATLYAADGTTKLAWAQAAAPLEPGRQWMTIPFYGLILQEKGVAGPYLVRFVALSTTTQMPNAKNRLVEANYRTAAYDLAAFTDQPFNDPGLLDAAARLERDQAALGGLDAGS